MARVDTSRLNRIIRNIDGNASQVVRTIAFAIERKAKELAPVDTGAHRSSYQVVTKDEPSQSGEVPIPVPTEKTVAHVGPAMEYSLALEYGTTTMAAQPSLTPAVAAIENSMSQFNGDWGRALTDG